MSSLLFGFKYQKSKIQYPEKKREEKKIIDF